MMQRPMQEWLKQRHRFSEWAGQSALPKDQYVRGVSFAGDELPGWKMERVEREEAGQIPARMTSYWRQEGPERQDTVLRVDVFELGSVEAAHEYLIDMLGEFQSAAMGRRPDVTIGDVVFGTDTVMLFARSNLVVLIRNAGRKVVPVTAIADLLDKAVLELLREG